MHAVAEFVGWCFLGTWALAGASWLLLAGYPARGADEPYDFACDRCGSCGWGKHSCW